MKRFSVFALAFFVSCSFWSSVSAQEEVRAAWQVTSFDLNANVRQTERELSVVANLKARNVGNGPATSFTFRLNPKATVRTVEVNGASASFRSMTETRGNLLRISATLAVAVAPGASLTINITYSIPVEANSGLAAISPIATQFLPSAFWYPIPNTPFTVRGADSAPFRLSVNIANVISSGVEKESGGTRVFEQALHGQPFFVQGDWDRVEGTADNKGITALVPKGASLDERRQADQLIALTGHARSYFSGLFGPAPEAPIKLIAVQRGAGFSDGGTILLDGAAFRRNKIDSTAARQIAEAVARLWIGGQTALRGEGSGVVREGLVHFLAMLFIEKQFGKEAGAAEVLRSRLAYTSIAKRDGPLSQLTPLDDTYYNSVPNKGALAWRLVDHRMGREAFIGNIRNLLQAKGSEMTLATLRTGLAEKGGDPIKTLLNQQLDAVTDLDLMIGLPQQRGGEWVSALRNDGSADVMVTAAATTDRGERMSVDATVPAKSFGEARFKTAGRVVRVEVDPEKFYAQTDYTNDVMPRTRELADTLAEGARFLGAQDFVKAEAAARELLAREPGLQEARIILARSLLAQNKTDEAEKLFRSALEDPLPTPSTLAWGAIGLGEIHLKRGQGGEAAKRFTEGVRADAEYGSSLAARAARISAEAGAPPAVDESARAFIKQFDQAIVGGKKVEIEARIVPGELVRFVGGIIGSQPEVWQTRVLRTELLDANSMAVDVSINAKQLGQERSGTALLLLARTGDSWKLAGIELFEVR
ncbi:MAG: tetratricopeptide repeat protein [Acidobacteriota bacterium]|nr:tetratricopeptide repeat protein [Acidobacteriota bacterium]